MVERCKDGNDWVHSCTECLWTEGCKWCEDPADDTKGLPEDADKNKIVKGCIKSDQTCKKTRSSKVPTKNTDRIKAMKAGTKDDEELSPRMIPRSQSPVLLTPKDDLAGEVL